MTTTQSSSNDLTIDDLEARIGQEYRLAKELAGEDIEEAVEHGRVLGQLLDRAKYKMASSEWNEWLRNTVGMSRKDAGKFMRLAVGEAPYSVKRQLDFRGEKSKSFRLKTDKNGMDIWREGCRESVAMLLWQDLPEVAEQIATHGLDSPIDPNSGRRSPEEWERATLIHEVYQFLNWGRHFTDCVCERCIRGRSSRGCCHCPYCEDIDLARVGNPDATQATRLEELLNFDRMSDEDTQFRRDLATLSPDLAIRTREPARGLVLSDPFYQRHPYPGHKAGHTAAASLAKPEPDPDNVFEAMAKGIAQWRLDQRLRAKHTTSLKRDSMPLVLSDEPCAKGMYHLSWRLATWLDGIYAADHDPYDKYRGKMAILLRLLQVQDPRASACVESALSMSSHGTPASVADDVGIPGSDRADVAKDRIRRGVRKMKVLAEGLGMVTGTPRQPAHKPCFDFKLPGRLPTENLLTDLDAQCNKMKWENRQEINGILVVPPFSDSEQAKPRCAPIDQVPDDMFKIEVTREREVEERLDEMLDDDDADDLGSVIDRLQQDALLNPPERLTKPAKTRNLAMVIETIRQQMPDFVPIPPKVDGRRERSRSSEEQVYARLCRMYQEQGVTIRRYDLERDSGLSSATVGRCLRALKAKGLVTEPSYGRFKPLLEAERAVTVLPDTERMCPDLEENLINSSTKIASPATSK